MRGVAAGLPRAAERRRADGADEVHHRRADASVAQKLEFTDLALFGLVGRWSLFSKLELVGVGRSACRSSRRTPTRSRGRASASALRSPLGRHVAIALSGGGGHLLDHSGMWTREALTIEWKKPIDDEFLAFDVAGRRRRARPRRAEDDAVDRVPHRGRGQHDRAVPRADRHTGAAGSASGTRCRCRRAASDPTTEHRDRSAAAPRLPHRHACSSLVPKWDLFVDFAVIDRGELDDPATRLPILDGGFDQQPGHLRRHPPHRGQVAQSYDDGDDAIDRAVVIGWVPVGVFFTPGELEPTQVRRIVR